MFFADNISPKMECDRICGGIRNRYKNVTSRLTLLSWEIQQKTENTGSVKHFSLSTASLAVIDTVMKSMVLI